MITRKELSDFAAFCYNKYNLEIQPDIVKDYIKTMNPIKKTENNIRGTVSHYKVKECSSNNISCSHVSFDGVKCNECEYYYPPSPMRGNYK